MFFLRLVWLVLYLEAYNLNDKTPANQRNVKGRSNSWYKFNLMDVLFFKAIKSSTLKYLYRSRHSNSFLSSWRCPSRKLEYCPWRNSRLSKTAARPSGHSGGWMMVYSPRARSPTETLRNVRFTVRGYDRRDKWTKVHVRDWCEELRWLDEYGSKRQEE